MPQLSLVQRQTIEQLTRQGVRQAAIARELGVHRSTIKRELDRNSQKGVYIATEAHSLCMYRKTIAGDLSQLGKKPEPGHFEPKNKEQKIKSRGRKPKKRIRRRRLQFKEYTPYKWRQDFRPYYKHYNKKRSLAYKLWKKRYEPVYRIRCYREAEEKRAYRDKYTFRSYLKYDRPGYLKQHILWQQKLNRFRRNYWRNIWLDLQQKADERRYRLLDILRELNKQEQATSQPENNRPQPDHSPDIKARPVVLSRPRKMPKPLSSPAVKRESSAKPLRTFSKKPADHAHDPPPD